ncbi:hypothetical protein [Pseudomonas sp. 18175]|uniref:hypothetical protein n=1 Tax=Pseudomonas sp. 18175 TaxID=3390056 RepID=UPI003D22BE2F
MSVNPLSNVPSPSPRLQVQEVEQPAPAQARTPTPAVSANTRSGGNRALAELYGTALLKITGDAAQDDRLEIDPLPAHSTFGQWWSLLGRAFQSPQTQQWIDKLGVEPGSILLTPRAGQIQFRLTRERDPQQILYTLTREDPGWAAISGPIMAAAKVLAAGDTSASFKPPLNTSSRHAPLGTVRHFYKEPHTSTRSAAEARAATLLQEKAFVELPPGRHLKLHDSRSEIALERHHAALADIDSRFQVASGLRQLSAGEDVDITGQLQRLKVAIPRDSSYQPVAAGKNNAVSLKQYLDDHGFDIPTTRSQLDNLANTLATAAPRSPLHGDYLGALAWPHPVDPAIFQELRTALSPGQLEGIDLSAFKNVLAYLLEKRQISPAETRNPRRLLDNLINSPKGQALGAALQAWLEAKSIKGSANDWLLAALHLDTNAATAPADPHITVEGYPLMSAENADKTASTVLSQLRIALLVGGKASAQTAALYTTLLLSSRAPEFLVKDIPPSVVLGSHAWVSFVTAVKRIEATSPGATAAMSYGQVMLHASIAPVTVQDRRIEYVAQHDALKHWAVANGMGLPTTDVAMQAVRTAFDAQVKQLREASETTLTTTPTRRDMALQALKKAFPHMPAQALEDKCITLQPAYRTLPGPYSMLDLYLERRALSDQFPGPSHNVEQYGQAHLTAGLPSQAVYEHTQRIAPVKSRWVSSSAAVDIAKVLTTLKSLPAIAPSFEQAFSGFAADVTKITKAQVKQLISTLPLEDRQNIEYGKVTIAKEMDLARTNTQQPRRSRTREGSVLVKTERNGQVRTYEINRLKGEIIRRVDLGDFPAGERSVTGSYAYKAFEIITPGGAYASGVSDERTDPLGIPNSFGSDRTAFIADAIVKDLDLPALKQQAKGVTTFDTERPTYEAGIEFVLNLIPLRSAIVNFQKGDLAEGLNDLAMDIFGFLIGVGTAAKAGKAAMTGASALSKAAQVAKIIGRTAVGSLNPVSGIGDLARGVWAGARKTVNAAHEGINYLRGAARNVDVVDLIKNHDIAQGTLKSAQGVQEAKTMAKFDETTQQWHAYDPRTKQAYGKPLKDFVAEPSTLASNADNLLHAGLSQDNVVTMGGRMKNVKFIGPEIHSFEDTYKGTKRLNITVHGDAPRPGNLFLFNGTKAYIDDVPYDAKGLLALLKSHGVAPEQFDNVRLLVCYGANGISNSFAKKFQKLIKRPVKAFEGEVMLNYGSTAVTADRIEFLKETARLFPNATPQHIERMADWRLRKDLKSGPPHDVLKEHGQKIIIDTTPLNGPPSYVTTRINYRPRHFS